MKLFALEHLDELRRALGDFMRSVAPAEDEYRPAYDAFYASHEDPDDIDWNDPRILAVHDSYNVKTAVAWKTYHDRVAASEARYKKSRIAVMGR